MWNLTNQELSTGQGDLYMENDGFLAIEEITYAFLTDGRTDGVTCLGVDDDGSRRDISVVRCYP